MSDFSMGTAESRFADMVWESEPVSSGVLAKKCEECFGWKKSTAFTVLKRLCQKGLFKNEGGVVSSLVSREGYYSAKSESFIEEEFDGSLPAFLAAFTANKRLSVEEVAQLRRLVDSYEKVE